jgi:NAD(P)H-hydrate epimerase
MTSFSLTRAAAREFDRRSIEEFGVPSIVLMENAGRCCAELMMKLNAQRQTVTILCGPGNNGGDGFVMARHLDLHGWPVEVILFGEPALLKGDAATNHRIVERSRITLHDSAHFEQFLKPSNWIVDALFGTGLSRALGSPFEEVVARVNASLNPVFAVDIPSGLDCDSGEPLGPTIRATATATFVARKSGFLNNPEAQTWTGEVHVVGIGAPRVLVEEFQGRSRH